MIGEAGAGAALALMPLMLLIRRDWTRLALKALTWAGAGVWIFFAFHAWRVNIGPSPLGLNWTYIYLAAAALAFLSGFAFSYIKIIIEWDAEPRAGKAGVSAFFLTGLLLLFVQLKMDPPGLLVERFFPGLGWIELLALSAYGGWLADKITDPARAARLRPLAWRLFSAVFFTQLALGLWGVEKALMTGKLHLPIPALIVGGPVYRGEGFFMAVLFGVTVLLAGPAWCSWLCYVGAWDDLSSRARPAPSRLPSWRKYSRVVALILVVLVAHVLRKSGLPASAAILTALAFGLAGVAIMVFVSRRTGAMVHCTAYCPIGFIACWMGKINPIRIRIGDGCTRCGKCFSSCRYDALSGDIVASGKPGESCTLCGDCVAGCPSGQIHYSCPGLEPERARRLFLIIAASLHAVFLGVARI